MKLRFTDKVLLIIIGLFLILSSTLVTYVVMSYISFKNDREDIITESIDKEPLDMNELNNFSKIFNEDLMSVFLSSITFDNIDKISITNSNLQQYVYPKMNNVIEGESSSTITIEDFIDDFYDLTGLRLEKNEVINKSLYKEDVGLIEFIPSNHSMYAEVQITSSYKIDDTYYFDISIDNTIYGTMKRSLALKREDNIYKFIYLINRE